MIFDDAAPDDMTPEAAVLADVGEPVAKGHLGLEHRSLSEVRANYIVGIDMGGTSDNVTVLGLPLHFVIDRLMESPSRVTEGPTAALEALEAAFEGALRARGVDRDAVQAVGLGTPGPASPDGVLSSRGGTNFSGQAWRGFDIRSALEERLGLPVSYVNDANAAALYAHHAHFGPQSAARSSVSAIVGTGLGGGIVLDGGVVKGSAGMAGELGHIRIPLDGVLAPGQPMPVCNCGRVGDAESVASLSAIGRNLLPYWLTRFPRHRLAGVPLIEAARELRSLAEEQDPLALAIFSQQAGALGRLLTIVADVIDPDVYFIGGGVVEARPSFSEWFVARVEESIAVREEQSRSVKLVTDGDMAGARGAALTAWQASSSGNLW